MPVLLPMNQSRDNPLRRGGAVYGHPFDGDGMLSRFAFSDQGIHCHNRFVRTNWFLEEEAAGPILYRSFRINKPGGFGRNLLRVRFKNAANTNVVFHGGKLPALWEGGLPHRGGDRVRVSGDPCFALHFADAYEEGGTETATNPGLRQGRGFIPGGPWRLRCREARV